MYVYVIAHSLRGPCKIGMTRNPASRWTELQIGSPVQLRYRWAISCVNAAIVERCCHDQLRDQRRHSHGEWFRCGFGDAVELVKQLATALVPAEQSRAVSQFAPNEWDEVA